MPIFTPAHRGKGSNKRIAQEAQEKTTFAKRGGTICVQRLKRMFNIDIEVCDICGKNVKIIAYIDDPVVIKKIPARLKEQTSATKKYAIPEGRSQLQ